MRVVPLAAAGYNLLRGAFGRDRPLDVWRLFYEPFINHPSVQHSVV